MRTLVTEVGKQVKCMGFFLALKAHIFPGLFDQGCTSKTEWAKFVHVWYLLLEKIAIPFTVWTIVKIEVLQVEILLLFARVAYNISMQLNSMKILLRAHFCKFVHFPSSIPQYLNCTITPKVSFWSLLQLKPPLTQPSKWCAIALKNFLHCVSAKRVFLQWAVFPTDIPQKLVDCLVKIERNPWTCQEQ